jgi:hypothetical protein
MRYSCRIINRDGSADTVPLGDYADPSQASRAARSALLVSLTGFLVELWSEGRLVAQMNRDVAQFRSRNDPFPHQDWSKRAEAAE